MKNLPRLSVAFGLVFATACHHPVAYFSPTPYRSARLKPILPAAAAPAPPADSSVIAVRSTRPADPAVADVRPEAATDGLPPSRVERRMRRVATLLADPTPVVDRQPKPKPQQPLRLGNRIRQGLGMPLRKELTWWQRISWKLKASVIVIVVAVVFAILHITLLAIIFGIVGAFLLVSGLRRSFKVRRPWF